MNQQIYEEAGEWVIKHRTGGLDARDKKTFDAWLRDSPQHVRAYLEMSSVWEDVPLLDPAWNPGADELIARAQKDNNVVSFSSQLPVADPSLSGEAKSHDRSHNSVTDPHTAAAISSSARIDASKQMPLRRTGEARFQSNRKVGLLGTLAASILVASISGWFYLQHGVYATDIGEQRSLALADGSTVELNSRSRIRVRYTEHERRIDLLRGQALFHVAKNKARPFIVQTDNTQVRAVGTAFDVYNTSSGTIVTVVEGRVAVHTNQRSQSARGAPLHEDPDGATTPQPGASSISSPTDEAPAGAQAAKRPGDSSRSASLPETPGIHAVAGEILLAAGEQLVVAPAIVTSPKRANVAAATAWTRRSLVFDSSPLTEVAQEFNRYNTRRLVVEDPLLADFHVSGVFSSVEPTLFLRFLRAQPELVIKETDTEIRITRR